MSSILAFSGSNSSTSINYKLVKYTLTLMANEQIQLLDMSKYPFPMYSEDHEKEHGFLNSLVEFKDEIRNAKAIILSVNEHNSYPSAYFKNLIDWLSRLDRSFIAGKKIFLMSTSGGSRGAVGALEASTLLLTRFKAEIVETFSLPNFHTNFDDHKGITATPLAEEHLKKLNTFLASIS